MIGKEENKTEEELTVLLPIKTVDQIEELEEKLLEPRFFREAVSYSKFVLNAQIILILFTFQEIYLKQISANKQLEHLFRRVVDDKVYIEFNVDGSCKKKKLLNLQLFNKIVYSKKTFKFKKNRKAL